ncbi:MAG: adaptor protein MecA [Lachnospiraceae bacterium]|nr:adaptor protein MecA [Lachnospiraceae bacterium]
MKIEKLNDYQIRCTLTKEDLARRGIKVSELAYGTDNARELFRDMMEQAAEQFGFTPEDMPVMVEAIPYSTDCLVLIISKCDDPEELDTRFASFAPSVFAEDEDYEFDEENETEDFASLFSRIQEGGMPGLFDSEQPYAKKVKQRKGSSKKPKYTDDAEYRIFSFPLLHDIIEIAGRVEPSYHGRNTLYKSKLSERYMLLLHRQAKEDPVFSQICLMLSEYGQEEPFSTASEQFLEEHNSVLIRDKALQILRRQNFSA